MSTIKHSYVILNDFLGATTLKFMQPGRFTVYMTEQAKFRDNVGAKIIQQLTTKKDVKILSLTLHWHFRLYIEMRRQLPDARSKKGSVFHKCRQRRSWSNCAWSGPSLPAYRINEYCRTYRQTENALLRCANAQADLSIAVRLWHQVYFVLCYKAWLL